MTTQSQFFIERASIERKLAEASKLQNVREGHLRAAEAWDVFAARALKSDKIRAEEQQRKLQVSESGC